MSDWASDAVDGILFHLDAPDDVSVFVEGDRVAIFDGSEERVSVDVDDLRDRTMDSVRSIYRGLGLSPGPHAIERAWKSVEVEDGEQ